MQINTTAIKQLNAFTQFAADSGFKSKRVAKLDEPAQNDGAVRTIKASTTDSAYALRRHTADKNANDAVRRMFKQTIIDLFGGENRIPSDVRKKMELGDYNKGKPLTARRIAMVKDAVIKVLIKNRDGIVDEKGNARLAGEIIGDMRGLEEVAKQPVKGKNGAKPQAKPKPAYAVYNKAIADNVEEGDFNRLPRDIQRAFEDVMAEVNVLCGEGTVTTKGKLGSFIGSAPLTKEVAAYAKVLKRNMKGDDMRLILRNLVRKTNAVETRVLSNFLKSVANGPLSKSVANGLLQNVPGLKEDLKRCRTAEAVNLTLEGYRQQLETRVRVNAIVDRFIANGGRAVELLIDEYAKATGLSREKLAEILPLREYRSSGITKLAAAICSGENPAQTEEDIEKAFRDNAKEYLRVRQDIANEADRFVDIPDKVRENLRLSALTASNVKGFSLAKCRECATYLDLLPFRSAMMAEPFSLDNAVNAMRGLFPQIRDIGRDRLKDDDGKLFWNDYGADDIQQFAATVMKFALADDRDLVAALNSHADEIRDGVSASVTRQEAVFLSMNTGIYLSISEMAEAMNA
jgi:hypothetical protein